jgi:chemotaxis signal transduction protein
LFKKLYNNGNSDMTDNRSDGHVFVFPALRREIDGLRIFYLFSIRQVAEVMNHVDVQPVPFAPPHAEGLTRWRGHILPVMSLEHCLGISVPGEQIPFRTIVARTIARDANNALLEMYTVFKVGAAIRQINLPLICEPTGAPDWIADASVLSGVYQLKNHLYLVMNMEAVLTSNVAQA